jgi:three-Cys-motif partner protein
VHQVKVKQHVDLAEQHFIDPPPPHGKAKAQILSRYLKGWFAKLGQSSYSDYNQLFVFDMFAGCGKHHSLKGEEADGSPISAIKAFLSVQQKLKNVRMVYFVFREGKKANAQKLEQALADFVHSDDVQPHFEEWATAFQDRADEGGCKFTYHAAHAKFGVEDLVQRLLQSSTLHQVPTFAFLDPFGYSLPMDLVQQFLGSPKAEVLLNFNLSGLMRGIAQGQFRDRMNVFFGNEEWDMLNKGQYTPGQRREMALKIYTHTLKEGGGAKFTCNIAMRNPRNGYVYFLLHATKHPKGLELMKDTIATMANSYSTEGLIFSSFQAKKQEDGVAVTDGDWLQQCADEIIGEFQGQEQISLAKIEEFVLYQTPWPFKIKLIRQHMHNRGVTEWPARRGGNVSFPLAVDDGDDEQPAGVTRVIDFEFKEDAIDFADE